MKPIQLIAASVILVFCSCTKYPYKPNYSNVKGYVIAKETCKFNEDLDYWLIDLTYFYDTPQYGDTLILNGRTYTNVIKTASLQQPLKQIGMAVSLDFKTITQDRIESTGCDVPNAVTYKLKELSIINQFEIR